MTRGRLKSLWAVILFTTILITGGLITAGKGYASETITPQLSIGFKHCLALKSDGTVWAWGENLYGELGDGTETDHTTPVQVIGTGNDRYLTNVTAISAGYEYSLALKADGSVWAWGDNTYGQLGTGNKTYSPIPVRVKSPDGSGYLTGIKAISAGNSHCLALKQDGSVWAWGDNMYGQLGNGTKTASLLPIQVKGPDSSGYLTGITAISAGELHNLALMSNGSVWAWGDNTYGQLGDGSKTSHYTPVQVKGADGSGYLAGVTAISAGSEHNLALKNDGSVWAWGHNTFYQVGELDQTTVIAPWPVKGPGSQTNLIGVKAISCGDDHNLVLMGDGSVYAWGRNDYQQLGVSNTDDSGVLIKVLGTESGTYLNAAEIDAGGHSSLAMREDGSVWAWGNDWYGQMGNGTFDIDSSPLVQVKGLEGNGYLNLFAELTPVVVSITDPGLEAAIRSALSKPTGDITDIDMASLTSLRASNKNIRDLTGLEYATNLEELYLSNNLYIQNINILSNLTMLKYLYLDGNQISDISSLAGLINLEELKLGDNEIVNIDSLASLTHITYLDLSFNMVVNISALANLTNLENLDLANNNLDVSNSQTLQIIEDLSSGGTSVVYDNQNSEELPVQWDTHFDKNDLQPADKVWTISFNKAVYQPSVNAQNIYVTTDDGKTLVPVTLQVSADNQVQVKPPTGGWTPGASYYLFITDQIKAPPDPRSNQINTNLKQGIRMKFTIENQSSAASGTPYWVEDENTLVKDGTAIYQDDVNGICYPYISPDRNRLVYSNGYMDLYLVDLKTGIKNTLELPQDLWKAYRIFPCGWSADSKQVLLQVCSNSGSDGGNDLYIITLNDINNPTLVTQGVTDADWGTNGEIVVAKNRKLQIYDESGNLVKDITTDNIEQFTSIYYYSSPSFSPDCQKIVYNISSHCYLQDYVSNTYTKLPISINDPTRIGPDGKLIYEKSGELYIYDPATEKESLYYNQADCSYPNWLSN